MRALRSYEMPPPATACFIAVCLVCGVVQLSMDPAATRRFTLSGNAVFVDGQWYRVITSAFLHGGALHLGMNALSTAAIGAALERRAGSAFLFCYAAWAAPLSGFVAAALAFGWTLVTGDPAHAAQHGLGFSGVIFALAASEAWRPPDRPRSLFGLVAVPGALYPWALLVAMQVAIPRVSFVGHLAGLLVGFAEVRGLLDGALPGRAGREALDGACRPLRLPGYVASPADAGAGGAAAACELCAYGRHVAACLASRLPRLPRRPPPPPAPVGACADV